MTAPEEILFRQYRDETDIALVTTLIDPTLSEPYSIFTYRFFLSAWPQLCHFCYIRGQPGGVAVGKIDDHKSGRRRGYIGMVVVLEGYRKMGIGCELVKRIIEGMLLEGVDEIVLECETDNVAAIKLYEKLGFLRDKRLQRYYLTGSDAYRLKLRLN